MGILFVVVVVFFARGALLREEAVVAASPIPASLSLFFRICTLSRLPSSNSFMKWNYIGGGGGERFGDGLTTGFGILSARQFLCPHDFLLHGRTDELCISFFIISR